MRMLLPGEFVLYDLEYTSWLGSKETHWSREGEHREIVEIGALHVRRNGNYIDVLAEFSTLVCPKLNSQLSEYFKSLTGITQQALDVEGVSFERAWQGFLNFVSSKGPLISFGEDREIIVENLALNNMGTLPSGLHFKDYRDAFCRGLGVPISTCSGELPRVLGLSGASDQAHRALNDVYAQIVAMRHLFYVGC